MGDRLYYYMILLATASMLFPQAGTPLCVGVFSVFSITNILTSGNFRFAFSHFRKLNRYDSDFPDYSDYHGYGLFGLLHDFRSWAHLS